MGKSAQNTGGQKEPGDTDRDDLCELFRKAVAELREEVKRRHVEKTSKSFEEGVFTVPVPDWDDYFAMIAETVSMRSKDPKLKVGAVVVGIDKVVVSTGFNGFPRGIKDLPERWNAKESKLELVTHAEANAIFNAARTGVSCTGCTIYTTKYPCTVCAQAIVQSGIKRVFTYGDHWQSDPYDYRNAAEIFAESKIVVVDARNVRASDNELRGLDERFREHDRDLRAYASEWLDKHEPQRKVGDDTYADVHDIRGSRGKAHQTPRRAGKAKPKTKRRPKKR